MPPQTKAPGRPPSTRSDNIGLGIVGVALVLSGIVWTAVRLTALATGQPSTIGLAGAGQLLVRWGADPFIDGPPAPLATPLPASAGIVQGVAGAMLVALSVTAGGGWLLLHGRPHRRGRVHSAARWGAARELAAILVRPGEQRGRLVLGEYQRTIGRRLLVAVEQLHSVFVLGPTQSRKTSGLAIPALLEWDGPAIVTSVKRDLLDATERARYNRGEVVVFDPAGFLGDKGASWDVLADVTSWAKARELAKWLTEAAAVTKLIGDADKGFFELRAQRPLAAAVWAAALDHRTIGQVRRWVDELAATPAKAGPGEPDVARYSDAAEDILLVLGVAGEEDAMIALKSIMDEAPNQRSGTITSAQAALDVFGDENVERACSSGTLPGGQIVPDRILDGTNTLYLYAPLHEQDRLRPVFEALIMSVVRCAQERTARSGQPLELPLLVLLDEAGNVAPLQSLAQIASTGAGQAIQLLTIFQDFAQLKHRYGGLSATVVNNHRAKVLLSGLSDPDSLEYVSRLIGDAAEAETSTTVGEDRTSTTEHTAYRRLAPPALLRATVPGEGVVVYGHLPPAKIRLRWWERDKDLAGMAGPPPQERGRVRGNHPRDTVRDDGRVIDLGRRRRRRRAA